MSLLDECLAAYGGLARWRAEEAVEAFDRALLPREDFFEARLYKGRTMYRICHSMQAHWRAVHDALGDHVSEEERRECLLPVEQAFHCWVRRCQESLEAASGLRPKDAA